MTTPTPTGVLVFTDTTTVRFPTATHWKIEHGVLTVYGPGDKAPRRVLAQFNALAFERVQYADAENPPD